MSRLIAKITRCPNKEMAGCELRRLRVAAGMSERALARKLDTYRRRVQRWEKAARFEIHPELMALLLKTLGATSL